MHNFVCASLDCLCFANVIIVYTHTHTHTQPKVVTDVDEEELRKQMEELQLANKRLLGTTMHASQ